MTRKHSSFMAEIAAAKKDASKLREVMGASARTATLSFPTSRQEAPAASAVPEGCTPADARMLRTANHGLAAENDRLREALQFYADGSHFMMHDADAWDTVSGEPTNFYEDESNTATVEDGSVAKMALANNTAPTAARSPATVAQPVTDEQIRRLFVAHGHLYAGWLELGRSILALRPPSAAAQPCPSQGCVLSDAQCREIYWELDKFGKEMDHYEYGLPLLQIDDREEQVFKIIRDAALSGLEHVGKESE